MARRIAETPTEVGDRQQQEQRGEQLQQQRPGLLDLALTLGDRRRRAASPEAQGRNADAAARAIVEVERNQARGHGKQHGQELG